jgi:putative transposase
MGRLSHRTGEGWTYFVTTKSWENTFWFQADKLAPIVVGKMLEYRDNENYFLHDFVLMPNHLHVILTPASASLEKCMQLIKGGSSFEIHKLRGSKSEVWQSGFHESRVTGPTDYQKKRDYVWFNPVAAKLVERPEVWSYGSASGKYKLAPVPQGQKPIPSHGADVGAKAPTPGAPTQTADTAPNRGKADTQGLKPLPPEGAR